MQIRTGFSIALDTVGPTPMNLLLNVRPERRSDLVTPETITFDPPIPARQHVDAFGNVCTRIVAPGGRITMTADFTIADSGLPDDQAPGARQRAVQDLPDDVLMYLLGSRYSAARRKAGRGSRRSSTSRTRICASTTSRPTQPAPPSTATPSGSGSAGISRIWRSPCAAA
jgi:hypothetical protein